MGLKRQSPHGDAAKTPPAKLSKQGQLVSIKEAPNNVREEEWLNKIRNWELDMERDPTAVKQLLDRFRDRDLMEVVRIRCLHSLNHFYLPRLTELRGSVSTSSSSISGVDESVGDQSLLESWNRLVDECLEGLQLNPRKSMNLLQVSCLKALMDMVKQESLDRGHFSNDLFLRVCRHLLGWRLTATDVESQCALLPIFCQHYCNRFDDIRFYFFRNITNLVKSRFAAKSAEFVSLPILSNSLYHCLMKDGAEMPVKESDLSRFFGPAPTAHASPASPLLSLRCHRKEFGNAWIAFLSLPLTPTQYRLILVVLHENVIPNMADPRRLHDFLTDSYNQGGSTSFLALNGLFTLIHKHNLDYPDFYQKLYALLTLSSIHSRFSSRFLKLLNLFLKSSHLPSYMVAAFIKKLARLAVYAPANIATALLVLVYNLLRTHPTCRNLLHRLPGDHTAEMDSTPSNVLDEASDPFDMDETDLVKVSALQSSLWELQVLQNHQFYGVSNFAKQFTQQITEKSPVISLEDHLDKSISELVYAELETDGKSGAAALSDPKADFILF